MCVKKLIFACINKVDPKQPCKFGNIGTQMPLMVKYYFFSNVFHKREQSPVGYRNSARFPIVHAFFVVNIIG